MWGSQTCTAAASCLLPYSVGLEWNTRPHACSASTLPLSRTPQPHRQFPMCVLGIWTQVFMLHLSSCVIISATRIPTQKTRVRELITFPCKLPFSFLVHGGFRFALSSSHSQVHTITLRFTSLKCKLWSDILIKRNWMPCWFSRLAIVKCRCVFTIIGSIIFIFDKEYSSAINANYRAKSRECSSHDLSLQKVGVIVGQKRRLEPSYSHPYNQL